jgi:hypothetical protein
MSVFLGCVTQISQQAYSAVHSFLAFVGLYFMVLQICNNAPITKIYHLNPSIDRNIKIVQQLEQVFRPYCIMFKRDERREEGGSGSSTSPSNNFFKKIHFFFGREHLIIREFSLFREVLGPKPHKKGVINVYISL